MKQTKKLTQEELDRIVVKYRGKSGELLSVLEEAQKKHPNKFLPQETLEYIAGALHVPMSQVYSVVTFYAFFNLKPQGDHTIVVCRGTACHTRGSSALLDGLKGMLDFEDEELEQSSKIFMTTKDNKFTIKTVACFGQCALAPVVEIDEKVFSYMNVEKLKKLVKQVSAGEKI